MPGSGMRNSVLDWDASSPQQLRRRSPPSSRTPRPIPASMATRDALVNRFPYAVYFRQVGDELVVLAVMHGRRSLSTSMSRHGPLAHPRSMKISYHSSAAARATSRCLGTSASVMSLTWELSVPRIVAFEHAEQSRA